MSRSLALIRFNDTGNIYLGLYNGTVDIMYPIMAKAEDCWSDEYGGYAYINHISSISELVVSCEELGKEFTYSPSDVSDVEIYSDYGGGFFWDGKAVEKDRFILPESRFPFRNNYPDPWTGDTSDMVEVCDGKPEWAEEYMKNLFNYIE